MRRSLAAAACLVAGCEEESSYNEGDLRACVRERNPSIPDECLDAYVQTIGPALDEIYFARPDPHIDRMWLDYLDRVCDGFLDAIDEAVLHSSDEITAKEPDLAWTKRCMNVALFYTPPPPPASAHVAPPASAIDELYPCGDDGARTVLCASDTFPEGEVAALAMVMTGEIPRADPMWLHQFGFVFDADDDPSNNYAASAAYPNDFFDGTDLWFVAGYAPGSGWRIDVSRATGGNVVPVSSDARIAIDGSVMQLIVPAAELASSCPGHRMTAFSHLGDFGLDPPHAWSADVEPAVAAPLASTCIR